MHSLILGFDSFDPMTFEHLASQGKMPTLSRYVEANKYSKFKVSDPPQTEVSWTCISTGLDPSWHGVFDFVHREPKTYKPYVSLLPTQRSKIGVQFVPPIKANTIFDQATKEGYPATTLWWPATFPARLESPVRTIPGLGTPDILGRLGVGTFFTSNISLKDKQGKTRICILQKNSHGDYIGNLNGPIKKKRNENQEASIEFLLEVKNDRHDAILKIGNQRIQLILGQWSPIIEISFKMGFLINIRAITKVILIEKNHEISLYFLPLQIHPSASVWRYSTPPSFIKESWNKAGPFLSLGWPQDTTALEEGLITDQQFIQLCDSIFLDREKLFMYHLEAFQEGLFGAVFDSLDRIQHMFRRDRPDLVESWYMKLDQFVQRVENKLNELGLSKLKFLILSDHGFSSFDYKVHLNYWLKENGFLVGSESYGNGNLNNTDWEKSTAYAVGLNSLYINLKNREGKGIVSKDQYPLIIENIRNGLENWKGPDGKRVVQRSLVGEDIYSGPLIEHSPDILIGYSPGYRASSETGLGQYKNSSLEANTDHWGADHCIDSQSVPGVIFSNQDLSNSYSLSYKDIPILTIGKEVEQSNKHIPPSPTSNDEDQEIIEERLKSLGYL